MKRPNGRRWKLMAALGGGCLLAGPCGITPLQFQDFLLSTGIRIGVQSVAALVEATIINNSAGGTAAGTQRPSPGP
jgi:hypothetical protein